MVEPGVETLIAREVVVNGVSSSNDPPARLIVELPRFALSWTDVIPLASTSGPVNELVPLRVRIPLPLEVSVPEPVILPERVTRGRTELPNAPICPPSVPRFTGWVKVTGVEVPP